MARVRLPRKSAKMRTSAIALLPVESHEVPLRMKGNLFVKEAGIDGKAAQRKAEEAKNNPGFFRKYWYIIVPLGLLMLLSNAADPEAIQAAQAQAAKKSK
eukprot:g6137.t1